MLPRQRIPPAFQKGAEGARREAPELVEVSPADLEVKR